MVGQWMNCRQGSGATEIHHSRKAGESAAFEPGGPERSEARGGGRGWERRAAGRALRSSSTWPVKLHLTSDVSRPCPVLCHPSPSSIRVLWACILYIATRPFACQTPETVCRSVGQNSKAVIPLAERVHAGGGSFSAGRPGHRLTSAHTSSSPLATRPS